MKDATKLLDYLSCPRPLLMDGAMGTLLLERFGKGYLELPDLFVIHNPMAVSCIHEEYLATGADIIRTCSFNCNALSLCRHGQSVTPYSLAQRAAEIACEVAARYPGRLVAGSVGPIPVGSVVKKEAGSGSAAYLPQIEGLLDGGVDFILLETVVDALSMKGALEALRLAGEQRGATIPFMAFACPNEAGDGLLSGQSPEEFYATVDVPGLVGIGLNCGWGPALLGNLLERLVIFSAVPVAIVPNAGLPDANGVYPFSPSEFAALLLPLLTSNLAKIAGGCCGTTPSHILTLHSLLVHSK